MTVELLKKVKLIGFSIALIYTKHTRIDTVKSVHFALLVSQPKGVVPNFIVCAQAKKVIAVEVDPRMVVELRKRVQDTYVAHNVLPRGKWEHGPCTTLASL